ncbi:hypothetical protein L596_022974 [Steinernema carpocapsae]|uniref:Uncharacterized protein n=1 Tax=Steinernema carpocapsae TaxID=34508 RepID=A0A4U5MC69_STECR|nr:hypothetical protein L596_022974 [Steinernema carpocapsae]
MASSNSSYSHVGSPQDIQSLASDDMLSNMSFEGKEEQHRQIGTSMEDIQETSCYEDALDDSDEELGKDLAEASSRIVEHRRGRTRGEHSKYISQVTEHPSQPSTCLHLVPPKTKTSAAPAANTPASSESICEADVPPFPTGLEIPAAGERLIL